MHATAAFLAALDGLVAAKSTAGGVQAFHVVDELRSRSGRHVDNGGGNGGLHLLFVVSTYTSEYLFKGLDR